MTEARFAMLAASNPGHADELMRAAQEDIDERRRYYEQLAGLERGLRPASSRDSMREGELFSARAVQDLVTAVRLRTRIGGDKGGLR